MRRSVSESSPSLGDPPADPPELRACVLQPDACAELLEDLGRPFQGLARGALVPCLALHRPEREQRPGELEGVHSLRRLRIRGRRFERGDRALVVALRGLKEPSAAMGERTQSRVCLRHVIVEQREQPLRRAEVADRRSAASIATEPARWAW